MKKVLSVLLIVLCAVMLMNTASCSVDFHLLPVQPTEEATQATEAATPAADRVPYDGEEWVDKTQVPKSDDGSFVNPMVITEIYSDCFFAKTLYPLPYLIKVNGQLSDEWCVGDQVVCDFENVYYDNGTDKFEADMTDIRASNVDLDPDVVYKPVIYLYPTQRTEVSVKLDVDGELLCTYPQYRDGWTVTASPDGTLSDGSLTYNYLFWEGKLDTAYDFTRGYCVKGSDTAAFLEEALAQLGLNRKEANEFIVFWLMQMQDNPYNVISFQTTAYTDAARLEVTPAPDTTIRVFMAWYPSQRYVDLPAQSLCAPERNGFTVVEWGGARTK